MSNTSKGLGKRGSKLWIQFLVNQKHGDKLSKCIIQEDNGISKIKWLSPLKQEDYEEYMLNSDIILERIRSEGVYIDKNMILNFWPSQSPHWDAIGIYYDEQNIPGLLLVEAKANIREMNSKKSSVPSSFRSQQNTLLIEESMLNAYDEFCSGPNFASWTEKYYQLGNRLTFLNKLKSHFPVKLILLNIVNDETYIKCSFEEWQDHYRNVFAEMTNTRNLPSLKTKNIDIVYYNGEFAQILDSGNFEIVEIEDNLLKIPSKFVQDVIRKIMDDSLSGITKLPADPNSFKSQFGSSFSPRKNEDKKNEHTICDKYNFIPSDYLGECCETLVAVCYNGDDFDERLRQGLNHVIDNCYNQNKYLYFLTTQWDINSIRKYRDKILRALEIGVELHFILINGKTAKEMPYL
ncbi:MAG: hypothetical protein A2Y20_04060 [Firmicutes bacterium GWF2_51_9]|nr:MAG: hypothetical protein A2Y20_04060 [Firmicutes bacterium GWF2_51_9]OGS59604.1 MAG: hypothetical protein A2Y19_01640 [Firmicutes bacterium GWE2_51_13]HBZ41633.1 hypothetical protein [Erysipelotrichaceae bacterium]